MSEDPSAFFAVSAFFSETSLSALKTHKGQSLAEFAPVESNMLFSPAVRGKGGTVWKRDGGGGVWKVLCCSVVPGELWGLAKRWARTSPVSLWEKGGKRVRGEGGRGEWKDSELWSYMDICQEKFSHPSLSKTSQKLNVWLCFRKILGTFGSSYHYEGAFLKWQPLKTFSSQV